MISYEHTMSQFKPVIRSLAGPLEVEASNGYADAAVIGQSIGQYVRGWAQRAEAALGGDGGSSGHPAGSAAVPTRR